MINSLISSIIYLFCLLFPIFFLPITSEFSEYNKMILLVATAVLLFILYTLKIAVTKTFAFAINSFTFPLFLITALFLISTLTAGSNLNSTLITPLSTSTMLFGFILYILLINLAKPKVKETVMTILIIDASLLSIYSILLFTGIIPKSTFTPAGNLLTTAVFISIIAFYLITGLFKFLHPRGAMNLHPWGDFRPSLIPVNLLRVSFNLLSIIIIGSGLTSLAITLTTDQKPILLPHKYSLEILIQVLKDPKTLLLGVGPTKFVGAFTMGKPASINYTPFWNFIFTSSSSYLLNITTEVGLLVGILYIFLLLKALLVLYQGIKTSKFPLLEHWNIGSLEHSASPFILTLIFSLILQAILPTNMPVFILTLILFAISSPKKQLFSIVLSKLNILAYLAIIPALAISTIIVYFFGRFYLAEVHFKKGLDALSQNQGSAAYSYLKKAIDLNPNTDRYRVTFSQTSLNLANAIASQKEASDENKQNIPKLVQQAIDQARLAVTLNPTSVINWDNQARVYVSLTNFAQGSGDWAIEAYKQKITLDPNNPLARFDLGAFYLSQENYQEAESLFHQAVELKKDYPNFHYNLAVVLREQKKYQEAYDELKITLDLLPPSSEGAKKVEKEIDDLAKNLPQPTISR